MIGSREEHSLRSGGSGPLLRRDWLLIALLVLAAWGSFAHNLFAAAKPWWFTWHSFTSEYIVFDALWRSEVLGLPLELGHYQSTPRQVSAAIVQELDAAGAPFLPYLSQYGLQTQVFQQFVPLLGLDYGRLTLLTTVPAALLLGGLALWLRRTFGRLPALLVTVPLLLSPWLVLYARQLYWAPVSWVLPLLATALTVRFAVRSRRGLLLLVVASWAAVTGRMLSGYEFLSTIVIAGSIPLFYAVGRAGLPLRRSLPLFAGYAAAALLAALTAFTMHAAQLQQRGYDGWTIIQLTALKRAQGDDSAAIAAQLCAVLRQSPRRCASQQELLSASRVVGRGDVLLTYLRLPHALPWDWLIAFNKLNAGMTGWEKVRQWSMAPDAPAAAQQVAAWLRTLFLPLLGMATLWSLRGAPGWWRLMQAVSLSAPLSWFVLMSAHAVLHPHLDYVLWYLPTIPLALLSISLALCGYWRRPGLAR